MMFKNFFKSKAEKLIESSQLDEVKYKEYNIEINIRDRCEAFNTKGFCEFCGELRIKTTKRIKYDTVTGKSIRVVYFECPYHSSYTPDVCLY